MESIKQDLHNIIDAYMQNKGGDITPTQHRRLNELIEDLAKLLQIITDQNYSYLKI